MHAIRTEIFVKRNTIAQNLIHFCAVSDVPPTLLQMSSSGRLCLLVVAACLLAPAAVSAQIQFSEDWTHGKRDVSAQQQQLLAAAAAAADGAPRPPLSLLDVLSKAAAQQAAGQQCKPDAEALGLIYDLIMVSKIYSAYKDLYDFIQGSPRKGD